MLMLGPIAFGFPLALLGLLLLPLLWRRLRATPPAPAVVFFPPVRLLLDIAETQPPAAVIPPWLLALRLGALALLILACAAPRLERGESFGEGPLLLVLDDGWSAAPAWDRRVARAATLAEAAATEGVRLLRLAPSADGTPPQIEGPIPGTDMAERIRGLRPMPWPARPDLATAALDGLPALRSVWIRGAAGAEGEETVARRLAALGTLTVIEGGPDALILSAETDAQGRLAAKIRRADTNAEERVFVEALGPGGRLLGRAEVTLAPGKRTAQAVLDGIPPAIAAQAERLRVAGRAEAAAQATLAARSGAAPLLIGTEEDLQPLTGAHWYTSRALGPSYRLGGVDHLSAEIRLAVLPDRVLVAGGEEARALESWVSAGGTLLRFAGPAVAETPDQPLLPGAIRRGARALDGGLAWSPPPRPIAGDGPLSGIPAASDAPVLRHVLLQPEARPEVWIRLNDGSALVSATPLGRGRVVLVHVPSVPGWSDLPISAVFPEIVARVAALADGRGATVDPRPARLAEAIDALARPLSAGAAARSVPGRDLLQMPASPEVPPGIWTAADGTRILRNLGPALADPSLPAALSGVRREGLEGGPPPLPFAGVLAAVALLALLADHLAALRLQGTGWIPGRCAAILVFAGLLLSPPDVLAQGGGAPARVLPRLAHVLTEDPETDRIVALGLRRIAEESTRITSARLDPAPAGVRPGQDPLALYPILYWPVGPATAPDVAAIAAVRAFMERGGLLLLDTRDGGTDPAARVALERLVRALALPALGQVPDGHVLNQTFFLLRDGQPGRLAGAPVWIVAEPDPAQDGITPVIVGANDWALGWASDADGRPLAAFLPGGVSQRLQAMRFGVNLVLYALTGNYKSDQVHVGTILERLGQPR